MIIDVFLYFNEKNLFDFRINCLNHAINFFVIIKAIIKHQKKPKDFNFEKVLNTKLLSFKDKIKYHKIVIEESL